MWLFLLADKPRLRWLVWSAYVLLWTTLLVIPIPDAVDWSPLDSEYVTKKALAKTGHVCAYALMTILTAWLRTGPRLRMAMLFFLMAHAAGTEWIQLNVAGRSGTVNDIVLDHLGILCGLVLSWRWWTEAA
ncbi:MAG: hypothetical protein FJ271_19080 [Planctomycetes bacterium]|nr:hypothetical protein [Planctomycetota bacterium]